MKMNLFTIFLVFANLGHWTQILVHGKIVELCDPDTLYTLDAHGTNSSLTINLNTKNYRKVCRVNITAPSSHVINVHWKEHTELLQGHFSDTSPCPLNIYLPENQHTAIWKGNPCSNEGLPDINLLTPHIRLIWTPPRFGFHAKGRKLVITAVGKGDTCKEGKHHVCMHIGWKPSLCISEQLICDGIPNCPKGSPTSDEDEELCKNKLLEQTSWQQFAEEIIKSIPPELINNNKKPAIVKDKIIVPEIQNIDFLPKVIDTKTTTIQPERHHHDSGDSVSAALAHYGPWGYLMLGMLICGTVLMFCGLWECCFRKPKSQVDVQNQQQPTTVLIINRQQDEMLTHQPPNYDDLDQPPSYITLFPNLKYVITDSNYEDSQTINDGTTSDNNDEPELEEDHIIVTSIDNSINRDDTRDRNSPVICIVTSV